MQRTNKVIYSDDKGRELLSLKDGKAYFERGYSGYTADELDDLASVCAAAAEELRATAEKAEAVA
jgi:hypothetical protein